MVKVGGARFCVKEGLQAERKGTLSRPVAAFTSQ